MSSGLTLYMLIGMALSNQEYIFIEFTAADCSSDCFEIINPNFNITVYGYDPNMADVSASIITRQSFTADQVPFALNITLPQDTYTLIDPPTDTNSAKYYLHLNWDSDGNGQRCEGDLSFNYDALFPTVDVTTLQKQTLYLTTIPSTTPCTLKPTPNPTPKPTLKPTTKPTPKPTQSPSNYPSTNPTSSPTKP
eukprot:1146777_1